MKYFPPIVFAIIVLFVITFSIFNANPALAQVDTTPLPTDTQGPLLSDIKTQATSIHSQNFEGAFPSAGWTVTDLSTDGYQRFWDDNNYRRHLGSWAAWPANGGANLLEPVSGNDNYFNNMNTRMIYGPFSLAGATAADTDFYLAGDRINP